METLILSSKKKINETKINFILSRGFKAIIDDHFYEGIINKVQDLILRDFQTIYITRNVLEEKKAGTIYYVPCSSINKFFSHEIVAKKIKSNEESISIYLKLLIELP